MDPSSILVVVFAFVVATVAVSDLDLTEQRYAMTAFAAHLALSVAHWEVIRVYSGDAELYRDVGIQLARLLELDAARFGPEILKLGFHSPDVSLPVDVPGIGANTGTMCAISAALTYLLGPSILAFCLIASVGSWFGQLCLYRVARLELAGRDRVAAALGFLFVPSVIFWGAGFQKEAFVLGFFGPLALSTYHVLRHRRFYYVLGIAVCGIGVGLMKSYTLFVFVVSVAAFFYADRAWRGTGSSPLTIRPTYVVLALALAVGGVVAMGKLVPEYEPMQVAATLAKQQQTWAGREGIGSNTAVLGGEGARSLPQQIALVPLALVNALLRPSLLDIRNLPTFVAAVENTLLVFALLSVLRPANRSAALSGLLRTPLLVFAAVFVLVFGAGVGLGAMNLGSLSRYRAPLMPFYVTIVLVLRSRDQVLRVQPASRLVGSPRSRRSHASAPVARTNS